MIDITRTVTVSNVEIPPNCIVDARDIRISELERERDALRQKIEDLEYQRKGMIFVAEKQVQHITRVSHDRRERIATAALSGLMASYKPEYIMDYLDEIVEIADALIAALDRPAPAREGE